MLRKIPKIELHCHLEGAASPAMIRRLARRNAIELPAGLFDAGGGFAWHDFTSFLRAYSVASSCIRTPKDYRDITYEYLASCAAEGVVYAEVFSSPDHAAETGMSYAQHLEGIIEGIDDAEREFGVICRIIVTCVRHLGADNALAVAEATVAEPHPYVVGFGMAGDESRFTCRDFSPAFRKAFENGLHCTAHAGEILGPHSIYDAMEHLPLARIGHGVRAIEDPTLVDHLATNGIVLEVCTGSNLALGIYDDVAAHPLRQLIGAGCKVVLGSDDPPYFETSIGQEYERAVTAFGLSTHDIDQINQHAIDGAFCDEDTKDRLRTLLQPSPEHKGRGQ